MTDLSELNRNPPAKPGAPLAEQEEDHAHRHMRQDAMKAARRAKEREKRDENGNDEFKNIGPV